MKTKSSLYVIFFLFICFGTIQPAQGQLLKKLKKKLEDKTIKKVEEKTDEILQGKNLPAKNETQKKTVENETAKKQESIPTTSQKKPVNKHNTVILDDSDLMVFKSPISGFKDVTVQKIEELPRLGIDNMYMEKYHHPDTSQEVKNKRLKINYNAYYILMQLYFMRDYFKSMDKQYLTPYVKNPTREASKSRVAQRLLLGFSSHLATQKTILKYFCDQPQQDGSCNYGGNWGGKNADSFLQNEKYAAFVTEHLDAILKWSEDFFKRTNGVMYNVTSAEIGQYDFDTGGYWVAHPVKQRQDLEVSDSYFQEYAPQTAYGNALWNKVNDIDYYAGEILLKVDPKTAEEKLSEWNTKTLFFVSKTKIALKEIDINGIYNDRPTYTYHYTSPIIEVFTNEGLNDKIGEIDMNNLTFKEPE